MDKEKNYKINSRRINDQYFIDLDGIVHKFSGDLFSPYSSLHNEIAYELFPHLEHPKDYMMNLGWILVGSTVYDVPYMLKEPTGT